MVKKSTKKFVKNHLKDALVKRKEFKKKNAWRNAKSTPAAASKKQEKDLVDEPDEEIDDLGFDVGDENLDSISEAASDDSDDSIEDLEDLSDIESDEDLAEVSESESVDDHSDDESAQKSHLRDEIAEHKRHLEAVKEKDPEFYKFLLENDKSLLEFNDVEAPLEDVQKIMTGEVEVSDEMESKQPIVTKQMLATWKKLIGNHSIKGGKKLLLALRAVVIHGETDSDEKQTPAFKITSDATANRITIAALKSLPGLFAHYIPVAVNKGNKWRKLAPLVKSFTSSISRMLSQISDESMLRFLMREIQNVVTYFACFPKVIKVVLKTLLEYWSSKSPETRISAFLAFRRFALDAPSPCLDIVMKGAYNSFTKAAHNTNIHTWTSLNFMISCFVEIAGIDAATGYYYGFVHLRQLAMKLRNAITSNTKDNYKKVYCWQYLNSLKLWSKVLSSYCDHNSPVKAAGGSKFEPLIYPLVQITLGVMSLKPSSKYFPIRFHCARLLIDLSRKTNNFIPISTYLFQIFNSKEITSRPQPSTLKPLEFNLTLKAPNQYLGSRTYQTNVIEETCNLLLDHYDCFASSISFPELSSCAISQVQKLIKKTKNVFLSRNLASLKESLTLNKKFVDEKRQKVDFAPTDVSQVDKFLNDIDLNTLPLRKHANLRRKLKEEQFASSIESQKLKSVENEDEMDGEESEDESEDEMEDEYEMDEEEEEEMEQE